MHTHLHLLTQFPKGQIRIVLTMCICFHAVTSAVTFRDAIALYHAHRNYLLAPHQRLTVSQVDRAVGQMIRVWGLYIVSMVLTYRSSRTYRVAFKGNLDHRNFGTAAAGPY